ncbi:tyrosine-type recombinase/integrase [Bifidobacterium aerophilum]|uniref:Tyrosine-type recombinase/integrase n=1 Tax=Bifidobacterium aerophilum TaxID=1798155 RepID=A0A6N9Z589_9BIFI|nr:site-specific integrase [Bifidobacterium aerophilum]NEG89802.1 tyrosine-type recombinase/integrase [Bifidobacterium aerophilum]
MANITRYQTANGVRYRVRYRKPDGTQTDRRGFRRKIDAETWAAEHVTIAKAEGRYIDPTAGRTTVGTLWPAWIAAKKTRCKASYIDSLEREWDHRVEPKWGNREVASLTHGEIQEWVSLLTAGVRKAGAEDEWETPPVSATVVLRAEGILSALCRQAVRDRLIPATPCDGLELPKKRRKEHRYLTMAELVRLADAAGWRRTIVLTLGLTGIRWGELVGLRVGDVDLEHHRLWVRRNATEVKGEIVVDTPKSDKWRKVVYPALLDRELRALCGTRSDDVILFEARGGGWLRRKKGPNDESSWFYWARKRAGIKGEMTVHDLRHTAASLMIKSGANVKAVQRQLGHTSAAMTLDVYADLFDDDLDAVGEAMNALLLENVGKMWASDTGKAA